MWQIYSDIAKEYNIATTTVKNFIASGRIHSEDILYRPLRVYMTPFNCQLFEKLRDTKYLHENAKRDYKKLSWNLSSYDCYMSNYNCEKCIYSTLETLQKCNMPNIIEELLLKVGEPPKPGTEEYNKMITIRNNYIDP